MDPNARTLRFDLTGVSKEQVLQFMQDQGEAILKVILYEEIGTITEKPHLQGWALFGSKAEADNFSKNRLRKFKKEKELTNSMISCATIKKDSYFAYTAKDGKCVYSVGVTDEERIANEEKSYKKQSRDTIPGRVIAMFQGQIPIVRSEVASAVIQIYGEEDRLMYPATMTATVNLIMFKLDPEAMRDRMKHQL